MINESFLAEAFSGGELGAIATTAAWMDWVQIDYYRDDQFVDTRYFVTTEQEAATMLMRFVDHL